MKKLKNNYRLKIESLNRSNRFVITSVLALSFLSPGIFLSSAHATANQKAVKKVPPQAFFGINKAKGKKFEIKEATIDSIHKAFATGELTCVELVKNYLDRIESLDNPLEGVGPNSIRTVNSTALETAAYLDTAYKTSGPTGPLHCIPVLVKDQVETFDMPTTYGSLIFENYETGRDATIVERMRDAGAIILAKTNLGEFASGIYGSIHGFCRNPYNLDRSPSSSSCGTGAAIAANFGAVGIAEDTGGSTRGPAAWTNTVGLRPTTPLISRYGMIPASPTNDTLGPLTRTVKDAALLTNVIAGYDPNDPLTAYAVGNIPANYAANLKVDGLKGKRIGIIREPMSNVDVDAPDYARVQALVDKAAADMERLGATVIDNVVIPNLRSLLVGYGSYETEAATNEYLAQLPNPPVSTFKEIAFDPRVHPTRQNGLRSAVGRTTNDIIYLQAQQSRERLRQEVLNVMAKYKLDALAHPTFSHEPVVIGSSSPQGSNRSLSPSTGFPALAIPVGFTSVTNLPTGIDLLGRPWTEALLFEIAYAYESGTHHRVPPPDFGPLKGDINADGIFNCPDLALIKASFGKKTGQPSFNAAADVNLDGVVNVRDLSFVSRLLPAGTKCR
jgi:amidase